jgi:hypothetical protein
MTVNNNDFIDRIFSMSCQEAEDYAHSHGMATEDFLFLLSDLCEIMSEQEMYTLCDKHGIDYDKTLSILRDALKRHE